MSRFYLGQEIKTSLQQSQQLMMNLAMRQALHVLQLPQIELAEWLVQEIEANPILEIDFPEEPFKESLNQGSYLLSDKVQQEAERRKRDHQESMLKANVSLYEHLMQQAPLVFENAADLQLAEWIIGHLNEKGFLDVPLSELAGPVPLCRLEAILKQVQTFDPPGIAATSLRESLLLQLDLSLKKAPLAKKILSEHFDDLLHNRLSSIAKHLKEDVAQIAKVIKEDILPLDLHPGYRFSAQPISAIVPDLFFLHHDGKWKVEVNTSYLPSFHIAHTYSQALQNSSLKKEELFYLRRQLTGGRWLKKIVRRRSETLIAIGNFILKTQMPFFNHESKSLISITMQQAASELDIHESTVARAVGNKYVACPEGLFSLRAFFSQGISTQSGEKMSNHSAKEILKKMIAVEDRHAPLSDEALSLQFKKRGIHCARRTVAKYRSTLRIAPASQRKKF